MVISPCGSLMVIFCVVNSYFFYLTDMPGGRKPQFGTYALTEAEKQRRYVAEQKKIDEEGFLREKNEASKRSKKKRKDKMTNIQKEFEKLKTLIRVRSNRGLSFPVIEPHLQQMWEEFEEKSVARDKGESLITLYELYGIVIKCLT